MRDVRRLRRGHKSRAEQRHTENQRRKSRQRAAGQMRKRLASGRVSQPIAHPISQTRSALYATTRAISRKFR